MTGSAGPQYPTRATFLRTPDTEFDGTTLFAVDFGDWPGAPEIFAAYRAGEDLPCAVEQAYVEVEGSPAALFNLAWPDRGVAVSVVVRTADHAAELRRAADRGVIALTATEVFDAFPINPGDGPVEQPLVVPKDRAVLAFGVDGEELGEFLAAYAA